MDRPGRQESGARHRRKLLDALSHLVVNRKTPTAIIDGGFPVDVRARIVEATSKAMTRLDLQGIQPPQVCEGEVGANARVIGAASLPFFARYLLDREVLFKDA